MKYITLICSHLSVAALAILGSYFMFDPVPKMDAAQSAILHSYLDAYCYRIEPYFRTQERAMGAMVALSRVSVASGLGPILQVEYLRCMSQRVEK